MGRMRRKPRLCKWSASALASRSAPNPNGKDCLGDLMAALPASPRGNIRGGTPKPQDLVAKTGSATLGHSMWASVAALLIAAMQFGQSSTGELRVTVRDSSGLPVQSHVALVSEANDVSQQLEPGP